MDVSKISDDKLLKEIGRRFEEKKSSIKEMEFMTKKLLKLNEKNKEAQEVKSKFLSLIKNEFNNPMSSLLNLVNMMVKQKEDDSKMSELSQLMKTELLRLDFSLKNIFSASEIEAGEIANDYSVIDMQELFNETAKRFECIVREKSLKIDFILNCKDEIISDAQKLSIILMNLVSNACEYSFEKSNIKVEVDCDKDSFTLKVEDSGEGVSKDHAKEIYNRFSHFDSGTARRTAGLGLGLSVTRGMAEALSGTIDNISKKGKTIFIITIPKVSEEQVDVSRGIGSNEFIFDSDGMVEF